MAFTKAVFSGGGTQGLMFLGALKYMCGGTRSLFKDWVRAFEGFAGTSAGALIAFALACGKTPWDVEEFVRENDFTPILTGFTGNGIASIDRFEELICHFVMAMSGVSVDTCTFSYLQSRRPCVRLVIVATCVDTSSAVFWEARNAPDMRIFDALRCSACVPVVFDPVKLGDGKYYCDGCLTCNVPGHVFAEASDEEVAIFTVLKPQPSLRVGSSYIRRLFKQGSAVLDMNYNQSNAAVFRGPAERLLGAVPCIIDPDISQGDIFAMRKACVRRLVRRGMVCALARDLALPFTSAQYRSEAPPPQQPRQE